MDFGSDSEQLSRDGSSALVCVRRVTVVLAKKQLGKLAVLMDTQIFANGFCFCSLCSLFSVEQRLKQTKVEM